MQNNCVPWTSCLFAAFSRRVRSFSISLCLRSTLEVSENVFFIYCIYLFNQATDLITLYNTHPTYSFYFLLCINLLSIKCTRTQCLPCSACDGDTVRQCDDAGRLMRRQASSSSVTRTRGHDTGHMTLILVLCRSGNFLIPTGFTDDGDNYVLVQMFQKLS